jgi:hypothetical protein
VLAVRGLNSSDGFLVYELVIPGRITIYPDSITTVTVVQRQYFHYTESEEKRMSDAILTFIT